MMEKRYLTEYRVGPHKYGGDIWATSLKQAENFAKRRGIGEKVIGKGYRTGGLPRARTVQQKLHEAAYLGWIALEMGIITPKDLLGDHGLVHEYIHVIGGGKVRGLHERLKKLQRRIPGHVALGARRKPKAVPAPRGTGAKRSPKGTGRKATPKQRTQ